MIDFRIDEFSCTNLCAHYNFTPQCNRGFFIETLTESGTCTDQFEGTRLSFGACRDQYLDSSITYSYYSTDFPFKVISSYAIDKSRFPITIIGGLNDNLKITMDGITDVFTLGTGVDLLPSHVAANVENELRQKAVYDTFFRARCEYVNNKFEIYSSTITGSLIIHKEGTANETLGFKTASDTIGSGIDSTNTGSGIVSLSQIEKEVSITTDTKDHVINMHRSFSAIPSGSVEFDYTPYSESHLVAKLVHESEPICHVYNGPASEVSMEKTFTTTTGFYYEAVARYVLPSEPSNILQEKYFAETKFFKPSTSENLFYYGFERDYYTIPHAQSYLWKGERWSKSSLFYNSDIGYVNFYLDNDIKLGLQHPTIRDITYPFTSLATDLGTDKLRYKIDNGEGEFYLDRISLYELDYEDLVAEDDYSSSNIGDSPPDWTVNSGTGDIIIDYEPITGGNSVQISGSSSYLEKTFTACDTIRSGFRIYIPISSSGSSVKIALLNGSTENLNLVFDSDQEVKYNTSNSLPSGTSYEFDKWYYFEIMPDCNDSVFNVSRLGDPENPSDGWKYMDRGYSMPLLDSTDIDTIRFTMSSGTGSSLFYIKDVKIEDLDFDHDTVLKEDFQTHTLNEAPDGWITDTQIYIDGDGNVYNNDIYVTTDPADGSNKVVHISSHKKWSRLSYDWRSATTYSKNRIKYRIKTANGEELRTVAKKENATIAYIRDKRQEQVRFFNGLSEREFETHLGADTFEPKIRSDNTWYHRDLIIDSNLSEFSYYNEWQILGRREELYIGKHYDEVSRIEFHGKGDYYYYDEGNYIDEVNICGIDDLIDEDFNSMTVGIAPTGWTVSGSVLVVSNPSSGNKVIKLEDTSNSNSSSIYRSFTESEYVIAKFSVMAKTQGCFKIRIGDSDKTGYDPLIEVVSNATADGFVYSYASRRHWSYSYFNVQYSPVYRNQPDLPVFKRYGRVLRDDWLDFEIHAVIIDEQPYITMKVNGDLVSAWDNSFIAFKFNLPNFGLNKFDFIEITTDSYFLHSIFNSAIWSQENSHKNTLYFKDISVKRNKKGNLIFEDKFSLDDLNSAPSSWSISSGTGGGDVVVEKKNEAYDYKAAISLWDTFGINDLKADTFTSLGYNFTISGTHKIKIYFDCDADTYDLYVDNSLIVNDVGFYSTADYISKFYLTNPPNNNQKIQATDVGFDNFKLYGPSNEIIVDENFENSALNRAPSYWNTITNNGSVIVVQRGGAASTFTGNKDDLYTVLIANGNNVLSVDAYRGEGSVFVEKSFGPLDDPTISMDVILAAEFDNDHYIRLISQDGDILVNLKFNYDTQTLQFYDGYYNEWREFSNKFEWSIYRWYNIVLEIDSITNYSCKITIDTVERDTISLLENKSIYTLSFYRPSGYFPNDTNNFCIGNVEVNQGVTSYIDEDWSSYETYSSPSGIWTISASGSQVRVKPNPYFLNAGGLINEPVVVNNEFVDLPSVYGNWSSTVSNDFYITLDTENGIIPAEPGFCPKFNVTDSNNESTPDDVEILYYEYPYRITKPYNENGHIYITFDEGMVFKDNVRFKIHCDANNTISGEQVSFFKIIYSSEKGDFSTFPITTVSGENIELEKNGLVFFLDEDSTYNNDKFYFNTFSVYPNLFDLGNDVSAGVIRIGERSDVKCIRFALKSGALRIYDDVGINNVSWPIDKIGTTKIAFAFSSFWPDRQIVYEDFEQNYTATNDWITVTSGIEYTLYRDGMKFLKSNYVFFYIKIDEDNRGVGSINSRYYYDTGEYI